MLCPPNLAERRDQLRNKKLLDCGAALLLQLLLLLTRYRCVVLSPKFCVQNGHVLQSPPALNRSIHPLHNINLQSAQSLSSASVPPSACSSLPQLAHVGIITATTTTTINCKWVYHCGSSNPEQRALLSTYSWCKSHSASSLFKGSHIVYIWLHIYRRYNILL